MAAVNVTQQFCEKAELEGLLKRGNKSGSKEVEKAVRYLSEMSDQIGTLLRECEAPPFSGGIEEVDGSGKTIEQRMAHPSLKEGIEKLGKMIEKITLFFCGYTPQSSSLLRAQKTVHSIMQSLLLLFVEVKKWGTAIEEQGTTKKNRATLLFLKNDFIYKVCLLFKYMDILVNYHDYETNCFASLRDFISEEPDGTPNPLWERVQHTIGTLLSLQHNPDAKTKDRLARYWCEQNFAPYWKNYEPLWHTMSFGQEIMAQVIAQIDEGKSLKHSVQSKDSNCPFDLESSCVFIAQNKIIGCKVVCLESEGKETLHLFNEPLMDSSHTETLASKCLAETQQKIGKEVHVAHLCPAKVPLVFPIPHLAGLLDLKFPQEGDGYCLTRIAALSPWKDFFPPGGDATLPPLFDRWAGRGGLHQFAVNDKMTRMEMQEGLFLSNHLYEILGETSKSWKEVIDLSSQIREEQKEDDSLKIESLLKEKIKEQSKRLQQLKRITQLGEEGFSGPTFQLAKAIVEGYPQDSEAPQDKEDLIKAGEELERLQEVMRERMRKIFEESPARQVFPTTSDSWTISRVNNYRKKEDLCKLCFFDGAPFAGLEVGSLQFRKSEEPLQRAGALFVYSNSTPSWQFLNIVMLLIWLEKKYISNEEQPCLPSEVVFSLFIPDSGLEATNQKYLESLQHTLRKNWDDWQKMHEEGRLESNEWNEVCSCFEPEGGFSPGETAQQELSETVVEDLHPSPGDHSDVGKKASSIQQEPPPKDLQKQPCSKKSQEKSSKPTVKSRSDTPTDKTEAARKGRSKKCEKKRLKKTLEKVQEAGGKIKMKAHHINVHFPQGGGSLTVTGRTMQEKECFIREKIEILESALNKLSLARLEKTSAGQSP